jgi:hypothetical protein
MVLQEPKFKTYVSLNFIQTNASRRHKKGVKTTETNVFAKSNRSGSVNTKKGQQNKVVHTSEKTSKFYS